MRALILAVVLATASAATAQPAAPRLDPELQAAFDRLDAGDKDGWLAAFRSIAKAPGHPGVQDFLDGWEAILADPNAWPKGCAAWERAAPDLAMAAHFTGECYENGYRGVQKDIARAITFYQLAASGGYGKSYCAIGNIYAAGAGVPKDEAKGVALCTQGAELGDRDAQTDLGNFYLMGRGVARDPVVARGWFEKGAAGGNKNAAFTLGSIYWNGDGVAKDNSAAARWWKQAYQRGRRDASAQLAREALVRGVHDGAVDAAALREADGWYVIAIGLTPPHPEKAKLESELAMVRQVLAGAH